VLAAYLDGKLSDLEVAEIERHLDECRDCRVLVSGTARVIAEQAARPIPAARRRFTGARVIIAIAASLAVIILARRDRAPTPDVVRTSTPATIPGEGLATIPVHAPADGDSVRGRGLTFSWSTASAERYRLVVANEEGTPVWSTDTKDTVITLPDSITLQSGASYFWQVDAVQAGVTATTRLQRFTVVP
jgi:anti-sigma factor RsiW